MNEPGPLYQRVKDHILGQIRSGTWLPGARVPSENELVGHFRISRMTANRALKELTADGFLARVPGVGTFVKEPQARSSLMELRNIAEEIRSRGHNYLAHIEVMEIVTATTEIVDKFEMSEPSRLYHLLMLHKENGVPVQLEDRYVNPLVVPQFLKQDFARTTPTAYLVGAVPVDELEHTVEAVLPSSAEQRLLDIAPNEPCLALHRRSWSRGQVVTVAFLLYPGSRYTLHSRHRAFPFPSPLAGEGGRASARPDEGRATGN
jgi:GntR family histidine utilization transcriptional repressor